MLEIILKTFFSKESKRVVTLVGENRTIKRNVLLKEKKEYPKKQTCLSGYFKDNKGLNMVERACFNLYV